MLKELLCGDFKMGLQRVQPYGRKTYVEKDGGQMNGNEALKQFMLGLIYPAVLGTVLYTLIGTLLGPVLATMQGRAAVAPPRLKLILLGVTVAFYVLRLSVHHVYVKLQGTILFL